MNTERARTRSLRRKGIGSSTEAIYARRASERVIRNRQMETGERLPAWILLGLGNENSIRAFLAGLDAKVRMKMERLLRRAKIQFD